MNLDDQTSPDWDRVLQNLTQSGSFQISLVATGGGSGALARCFRRAGASRAFVEAAIPYSRPAVAAYLASTPMGSDASIERVEQLAHKAQSRAESFAQLEPPHETVGIALVAALPTSIPRRGQDRIHVALRSPSRKILWSRELMKGAYDRESAETIADAMLFLALFELQTTEDQNWDDSHGEDLLGEYHVTRRDR